MKKLFLLYTVFLALSCSKSPRFQLLDAPSTGIDFINEITETDDFHVMSYEYIYNGAGIGIGDLNNDGLQDIVFAGNQVSTKVYLNLGNLKFKDITANFTGLNNAQWYSGVTMVDINNDRLLDIYLTSTGKDTLNNRNRLWINQGKQNGQDPAFTEMAGTYGIDDPHQSVNAAFFDYDRDGDLDLYIINNTVTERMNTTWRLKVTDGTSQNNDQLYRNNGDGTFSNVTIEAGIVIEGFGLGLAISDVNKDGYPDIYVSNDYMSNDLLYINQKDGTFRNEIRTYLSYQSKSSMGNDIADINNDGLPDIYTMDMFPEEYYKKKQTINGFSYIFYVNDARYDYEHQYLRNMLHLHNGFINGEMIPFSESGQYMGIFQTEWSWSPLFADYDNDGDKDLIVANGYPKDMTDKDWTRYKAEVYGSLASEQHVIDMVPSVKPPNKAFENTGNLKFVQRTKEWLGQTPSYSYGASFVDLDNDGDLDYVTNNIDDNAFIYKNTTIEKNKSKVNFLKIKLTGVNGNTMALGAKVELWSNSHYQYAEHYLTRGYASSVDPVLHFGLSGLTSVDSVKITWPATGNISMLRNIQANQTIDVNESESLKVSQDDSTTLRSWLFEKQSNVIGYVHQQNDFPDFFLNQKIIPHKFSQIGPCIAQGDLDGDGLEDIIIGSTNIIPTTVFLRRGNTYVKSEIKGLTTAKDLVEAGLAILDMDNDGDNDVISISGGYENQTEQEYRHVLYINNTGQFTASLLPIPQFPASVIRPVDFNHDGYMDLFIGSRVKKDMYPYANHSWIILNDHGKLLTNPYLKLDLGMVTDAIWTDIDKDGWEDLLVAREWNTLLLLKNKSGKEIVKEDLPSLRYHSGIWYSIIAGDFDQDGDDDYFAGNLGENHRFTISEQYPLNMYASDIDMDGIIDPIQTSFWKDKEGIMKEYPVSYLDELWSQSNYFTRRYVDYTVFSFEDVNTIFDEPTRKQMTDKLQVNTTTSYILWNDKRNLRWERLPDILQFSPLRKMIVEDLNADQYPDVIVSGNDHTYDLATGYYDANKGYVMMNTAKNSFEILSPAQSGLLLNGMVESLIWTKDSLVIAGINRSGVLVYKYKK